MGAAPDIQLLSRCAELTLSHSKKIEEEALVELENSSRTSLIMTLRTIRLQHAVLAIGMLSLFESLLKSHMRWAHPFDQLRDYLNQHQRLDLAQVFEQYRLAVNVLKHGRGRSYDRLLTQSTELEFKIKEPSEAFFHEGDVSEVVTLIDADDQFVRRCAALVEEISTFIRSEEKIWI
jgi:hypothetical protein